MTVENCLEILLVDDGKIVHQTVAGYLRDSGHNVDRVHDPSNALEFIEERGYDVVFTDLLMLDMNGLSLLDRIQKIRPDLPVVIITERGNMDIALQALRLGAADFLAKPIKLLELDAVLEKSIRLRKLIIQHMRANKMVRKAGDQLEAQFRKRIAELTQISEKLQVEIVKLNQTAEALQRKEKHNI
jgi:DNA-binding NtrC family response regulator